jgi:chorismate-pyruvate lyase
MNIDLKHTFVKIWNYNINGNLKTYGNLGLILPLRLQILLTSDGSLTRHNMIIGNNQITINIVEELNKLRKGTSRYIDDKQLIRVIWLVENSNKHIFAQSQWHLIHKVKQCINLNKPLGKAIITSEIDIHRDLLNIYCGYCKIIEDKFNYYGPLWGRSYKISFSNLPSVVIDEIFSPSLIQTIQKTDSIQNV